MKNVLVTGGSGKVGRCAIRELLDHGYAVLNADLVPGDGSCHFLKTDLTDMGQAIDAVSMAAGIVDRKRRPFHRAEALVHLGNIPAPGLAPDATTFRNNLMSTYNVFSAAMLLGVKRVVWASSETVLGLPLTRVPPAFAPITEEPPPVPENGYALAKVLSEEMARQMQRWNPDTVFVGLRISNVLTQADYAQVPSFQADPDIRKWNLWSYVDYRDVGLACRLALEAPVTGAETFIIAAADTLMTQTNRELMAKHYSGVPLTDGTGDHETLLSIAKARRMLGYAPKHSWRDMPEAKSAAKK
jgi:nucleoside-diphosphate-sugar epimerase